MSIRSVGSRLREYRQKNNMSITEIAEECNCTLQAWSNYENERRHPGVETLDRFAQKFNVSIDFLSGATDQEYDPRDPLFYKLIEAFTVLSDDKKEELIVYAKKLKEDE